MTLIVETGSIVTGANTYASEAELTSYLAARGLTLGGAVATAEQLLLSAMDYIESRTFAGTKKTKDQPLQWPREGVYIDGFLVESTEIPNSLKYAQIETAIAIDGGENPMANLGRVAKREKVDVIEVEYESGSSDSTTLTAVQAHLDKLTARSSRLTVSLGRA